MKATAFRPETWSVDELLAGYSAILSELHCRRVMRSSGNLLGDYAELLFCRAFGWSRAENSQSGFDATDRNGTHYQIKARKITSQNKSRQLSAIRRLDDAPFHYLAGLLVDENFRVLGGALVPIDVVREKSMHQSYTNSRRFLLRGDIWKCHGVQDVTDDLRRAAQVTPR